MSQLRLRYKCCFIGEFGVGKTCFIRSVLGIPLDNVQATLGIDFFTTSVCVHDSLVHITLWDTAGAERYRSLMHSYVRDSDIVFIMYDLTNPAAMRSVQRCFRDLERIDPPVVAVLGTKADLGHAAHDVYGTIEPWSRQRWKIVTGTCSSLRPDANKEILKRCLKRLVPASNVHQAKPTVVHLAATEPAPTTCCA